MKASVGPRLAAVAATGMAAVLLSACGNDVPEGPMDDEEIAAVFPQGRDIPSGWTMEDQPSGSDRFGEGIHSSLEDQLFAGISDETRERCEAEFTQFSHGSGVEELVAVGTANYTLEDRGEAQIIAFSTQQETDAAEDFVEVLNDCPAGVVEADGDEVTDIGSGEGFMIIRDVGEGNGTLAYAASGYGQNHLLVFGISGDPRDVEDIEELVEAAQDRFEQGPDEREIDTEED